MEHRGPSARADGAKDDIRVGDGRSISHSTHRNEDEERPRLAASQARGIRRSSSVVGAREREEEAAAAGTGEGGEEEEYDEEDEYEGDDSVNGISSSKTTTEQISTTNGSARGHLDSGPRSHKDDKGAKSNTVGSGDGEGGQKKRRAFKACAHCRSRKAKCDLGDLNNPRDPPCTRCKRENVTCVFLPSRRGGRVPFSARQAKLEEAGGHQIASSSASVSRAGTSKPPEERIVSPKREHSPQSFASISANPFAEGHSAGPSSSSNHASAGANSHPTVHQKSGLFSSGSAFGNPTSISPPTFATTISNPSQTLTSHGRTSISGHITNTSPYSSIGHRGLPLPGPPTYSQNSAHNMPYRSSSSGQPFFTIAHSSDPTFSGQQASSSSTTQQQQPSSFPQRPEWNRITSDPSLTEAQQGSFPKRSRSNLDATLFNPQSQPTSSSNPLNMSPQFNSNTAPNAQQSYGTAGVSSSTSGIPSTSSIPGGANFSQASVISPSGESQSSLDSAHRKRKKGKFEDDNRIVPPETLAVAKLRNPVDALNLLVLAADTRDKHKDENASPGEGNKHHEGDSAGAKNDLDFVSNAGVGGRARSTSASATPPPFTLADFPLVKRGVISTLELIYFVNFYFAKIHHILPIVPFHRIPTTEAQLTAFARDELHLTTTFILISSRLDQGGARAMEIHDRSWSYMRELINDLVFGKHASVGAVEALLILSENPPRETIVSDGSGGVDENRMSWMLVGNAVRLGYMLALDQTTLYPALPKAPDTPEGKAAIEKLDRERIAWTYCYIFDRQISIRTGKAFWSRGPGLCFTENSQESFPSMRYVPGMQDDYAALIQAHVEITQIMTNGHDILYPSRDRTIALVKVGEYYKYIDEFTRTLNNFRFTWERKKWETFPITECVWITFHYLRLYIYAFAFQAHIQRASTDANGTDAENIPMSVIFPRGPMGSPDAKFILEAIDAAADLLRICVDRLHPQGVLQFLPWRYFVYFAYASVFLLRSVFINAVPPVDRRTIVRLLKRVIVCLACASKDEHHHAVKYARLLNGMLRKFSRGQDGVGTGAGTPSGRRSTAASPNPETRDGQNKEGNSAESNWPLSRANSPQPANAPTPATRRTINNILNPVTQIPSSNSNMNSFNAGNNNGNGNSNNDFSTMMDLNSLSSGMGLNGLASSSTLFGAQTPAFASGGGQQFSTGYGGDNSLAQEEQRAADLLSDFNLDFGFASSAEQSAPFDAYTNLLDDNTLSFWAALSNTNQATDWTSGNLY